MRRLSYRLKAKDWIIGHGMLSQMHLNIVCAFQNECCLIHVSFD